VSAAVIPPRPDSGLSLWIHLHLLRNTFLEIHIKSTPWDANTYLMMGGYLFSIFAMPRNYLACNYLLDLYPTQSNQIGPWIDCSVSSTLRYLHEVFAIPQSSAAKNSIYSALFRVLINDNLQHKWRWAGQAGLANSRSEPYLVTFVCAYSLKLFPKWTSLQKVLSTVNARPQKCHCWKYKFLP